MIGKRDDIPIVGGSLDGEWYTPPKNIRPHLFLHDEKYTFRVTDKGKRFYLCGDTEFSEACLILEKRGIR